jgi:hypothetical protein
VSRVAGALGALAAAALVLAASYVRRLADAEGRPVGAVLRELPGRLRRDARTIPDDLRAAAEEGRAAAARRQAEIAAELERARRPR